MTVHSFDAGVNACHLTFGPMQQPFVGEVALAASERGVVLVSHHDGVPTVSRVTGDLDADAPRTVDAGVPIATSPPCSLAGTFVFCMDATGAIHRTSLDGAGRDLVVARARPGTVFAAELIASVHVVVAYLAERRTSEGVVSEAYATLDDGPPLRLSDDGSGSTFIALAPRGSTILALMLDGRVAMTPVHARTLTVVSGKLQLSDDVVLYVGGGAEANTRAAFGTTASGTPAFALVPIAGESGFGLSVIRVEDPPRTDEPSTFSAYLNGLDPAPVAATQGRTPIRVARVRPLEARADGPRGLELGKIDDAGAFVSYGLVSSKGRVKSAAVTEDSTGSLWLVFTDGAGTWLERRSCP